MKIPVVVGECSGCGYCLMACPTGAAGPVSPKTVIVEKCTGCEKCVRVCPNSCRVMREVSAPSDEAPATPQSQS